MSTGAGAACTGAGLSTGAGVACTGAGLSWALGLSFAAWAAATASACMGISALMCTRTGISGASAAARRAVNTYTSPPRASEYDAGKVWPFTVTEFGAKFQVFAVVVLFMVFPSCALGAVVFSGRAACPADAKIIARFSPPCRKSAFFGRSCPLRGQKNFFRRQRARSSSNPFGIAYIRAKPSSRLWIVRRPGRRAVWAGHASRADVQRRADHTSRGSAPRWAATPAGPTCSAGQPRQAGAACHAGPPRQPGRRAALAITPAGAARHAGQPRQAGAARHAGQPRSRGSAHHARAARHAAPRSARPAHRVASRHVTQPPRLLEATPTGLPLPRYAPRVATPCASHVAPCAPRA